MEATTTKNKEKEENLQSIRAATVSVKTDNSVTICLPTSKRNHTQLYKLNGKKNKRFHIYAHEPLAQQMMYTYIHT